MLQPYRSLVFNMNRCCTYLLSILTIALLAYCLFSPCVSTAAEQVDFEAWLEDFKKEALADGISRKIVDSALFDIEPIPRVIELDRNQPEFNLSLGEYLRMMLSQGRIDKGKRKFKENGPLLNKIFSRYGVQPRFLVALWGIESDFGRLTGGFAVIGSLATLAYDGRRSAYFRKELLRALRILDQGHISNARMKGSWAGAMGQMQFMPSTFNDHAVDFNGNGHKDIWQEQGDILASAANYLSKCGWESDQTWGREVRLPKGFDQGLIGLKYQKRISKWQALGVRSPDGQDLPTRDLLASIVRPDGDGQTSRVFMVYNNYRVILKWNRSHNFVLAVGFLSDKIKGY